MKRRNRLWILIALGPDPNGPGLTLLTPLAQAATTGTLITRVYTDKARYNVGNPVVITAELTNTTDSAWSVTLNLSIKRLETQVYTVNSGTINLGNGASTTTTFNWTAPAGDFTGYYAGISAGATDFNGTGIDVSSSPLRFPRYGYISGFPTSRTAQQSTDMVNQLARDYKLNMFQFYDWMWCHEKMIKRTGGNVDPTRVDLFDRIISWQTIQNDIAAVRNQNAYAMAYAMSYAAREGYEQQWGISPTWGMYSDTGHASQLNVDFNNGKYLWLFNPANTSWQNWIINEYKDAINTAGFDGIQIDQMGQRNNVYDYNSFSLPIPPTFPQFLHSVKASLVANNPNRSAMTFNIVDGAVGGWAANQVATYGASDFDFSEIWYLSNSYNQLRNYIEQLRRNIGAKGVVLAGYMNYNEDIGPTSEAETATRVGVGTNTNWAGYTGSGFVDGFSANGDGVSFTINAPATDSYTFRFRYANATGGTSTRGLFVDGQSAGTVKLRHLYNWDNWETTETVVRLSAGVHQVALWYGSTNAGAINLDNLVVLRQTSPATTSATSLWMNNWSNLVGIHMASKLSPADTGTFGPRLGELRYSGDWPTNQIVDATAFFRDQTGALVKYTNANLFNSEAWLETDGTLTVKYLNYGSSALPVRITKRYAMVPNQPFVVVKYTFENLTTSSRTFNFLEQMHLNNKTKGNPSPGWQHGWWDVSRNALGTDMSQTGQFYMELGAFQAMDSPQVGNDANSNPIDSTSGASYQFDANGTLANTGDLWSQDLNLGFQKTVVIPANGSASLAFYYTIGSNQAAAEAAADTARAQTADYWFSQTATQYTNWLNSGKRISMTDSGLNTAFDRSLVINKQSQQPQFGSWPAATNPAYEYKVWVRDSAVTTMGMDATNHLNEAERYWNWIASVQNADGTWRTNYSAWQANQWIPFVEPEHDAIGLFLIGVYRHYNAAKVTNPTAAMSFLNGIWTQVTRSGDWIRNSVGSNGFGPADASIWEEQLEYNTFTQVTYAEGLNAARFLATEKGDTTRASNYLSSAQTIKNAILRSFTAAPRGLWNDSTRSFNRAVNTDGSARTLVDASTDLLWVFGMLPATDSRVRDQRIKVLSTLTHDSTGVARYEGDVFYYSSPYSPGGQYEAAAAEPVWPQMSMYAATQEHWAGSDATSLARLQWYVSRTGRGFVTPGEAVDWTTGQPLVSTMAQPVTGSWFQMGRAELPQPV